MQLIAYLLYFAVSAALLGVLVWSYVRFREKAQKAEAYEANVPQAAKLDDLKSKVVAEEKRLAEIQGQMRTQGTQLSDALGAIDAKRKAEEWLELNRPEIASIERERQEQREIRTSLDAMKQELAALNAEQRELVRDASSIDAKRSHAKEQHSSTAAELLEKTKKLEETQRVVESLQERRSQLRNEVAELDVLADRHKRLDGEVEELSQRRRVLNQEVEAADLKRAHLSQTVTTLSKELEHKTAQLDGVQTAFTSVNDQHTMLKAQVAELCALATRHEGLASKHEAMTQQVDRLLRQKGELARDVAASDSQRQQVSTELAELNATLEEQTQAFEEVRTTCELLRDERAQLKAETAQYEVLAKRQDDLDDLVAKLTIQRSELVNAVNTGQANKQQLESELARLRSDLTEVSQTLDAKRLTTESLAEQRAILRTEVAELSDVSKRQKELKQELASLCTQRDELHQAVLTAQQHKEQLQGELTPLQSDVEGASHTLVEMRSAIDTLRERQGILKGELAELETLSKQQQALREQINQMSQQERELIDRVTGYQAQKHELETTLPSLREELETTTHTIAQKQIAIESLREQERSLSHRTRDLETMATRADELHEEIAALDAQQHDLTNTVRASETRKHQLEEQLAPLASELSEKSRLLQQTRSSFDALCERQGLLKAEVAELDGLLKRQQALQTEVESLTQQQRELAGIVSNQQSLKQDLEQRLAATSAEFAQTSQRLDEARKSFDSLCEKQGALKAEVAELEGLSQQQKGLRIEVEALAQEQHQLVSALANQQTLKHQLEQEITGLSDDHSIISQQLHESRVAYEALCEKQGSLKAEVSEYSALAQQQRVLHEQIEKLTEQQRELAINVSSRLDQKAQLDENISTAKHDFAQVSTRLSEARSETQSLAERHGSLKAQVIELESLAQQQRALREEVATLSQQQRELSSTVSAHDSQRIALEEQLLTIKIDFEETSSRLGESRIAFDSLCEKQGTLKAQVIELEAMAQRDATLREQVEELSQRHSNTAAAVTQLKHEKQQLENQISPLRHDLEEKTKLLHDTRISVEAMRERQGALKGEIAELESLSARQKTLQTQVDDLIKQQRDLSSSVSHHEARRQQLEDQIAPLSEELSKKTQAMQQTREAVEQLAQKQAALKAEVAQLEVLSARQRSLQIEVGQLTSQHTELAHLVAAATHQKDALDDQLVKVAAELGDKSQALETTKATWHDLRDKQASLKTEVAELDALANRYRSLQAEVTSLSGQQSQLSKQVSVADSRKATLDEELATVSADLQEKSHALGETREAVDSLQERRAGLRAEVADLESLAKKHALLTQQVDQLSAAKRELDQALMTCDVQKGTAQRELASLHEELETKAATLDETKHLHQELTQQVASLRTQVSELSVLSERHAKLEREVASLTSKHAELDAQLSTTGQRKEHRDSELAEVTSLLAERRKAMDETSKAVEALKIQRNALTSEVADLEALATRHHELEEQIDSLSEQAKELAHEVGSGQMRRTQLQDKLDTITKQIHEHEETLKEGRTEVDLLREVRGGLKAEVAELTKLSETYQTMKNAVSDLTQKNAKLQIEVASLDVKKSEASERATNLADELAKRTKSLEEVRSDYDLLREQHATLKAEVSELSVLSLSRREESENLGGRLSELVQNLQQKSKVLDETKKRHDVLSEEVSGLAARREQLEKTVEVVSDTLKELRLQTGYRGNNAGPLSELWKPALIKSEFAGPRVDDEQSCLKQTKKYLSNMGLRFPSRVVNAFHTSLKVAEVSPLVVLAGISGTGKSELARRYAEGMGMHFLNLPVQPRWDSPQDMFGFFNYIENQYRATELARALVQMDPFANDDSRGWQTPEGWNHSLSDRMLVVLLDEMNLARVEYYFSEFLSRLETRRGIRKGNANDRRKAEITLEVGMHGATDPTMRLFVDTNVLFVGTINEDETTQTLSEKVVDRSNVMAFGRPPRLTDMPRMAVSNGSAGHHSEKFVAFKQWQQWIRKDTDLESAAGAQVNRWIEEMNQAMEMIRRPFAFRTHAAIRAYAANYPEQGDKGLSLAMADQIEQKILPKFRGLDPNEENVGRSLDRIVGLLDELGDGALISAIESSRRDGTREHQFIFRGVDRSADLAEAMA